MLVEREFAVIDHFAAMMVVEQTSLLRVGGPFHRPAQLLRDAHSVITSSGNAVRP